MTSPLGFKARVGPALFTFFAEVNVIYIPQDPPLALHLPTCNSKTRQNFKHFLQSKFNKARDSAEKVVTELAEHDEDIITHILDQARGLAERLKNSAVFLEDFESIIEDKVPNIFENDILKVSK